MRKSSEMMKSTFIGSSLAAAFDVSEAMHAKVETAHTNMRIQGAG
ncbi:hypothetical protein ASA1KI_02300 [Opitutales bacterium ASA1]|nr:hypothetical protein ASA1KI_02300 [Opitutales bacterium ASA1]